jgi:hypothetical protein
MKWRLSREESLAGGRAGGMNAAMSERRFDVSAGEEDVP